MMAVYQKDAERAHVLKIILGVVFNNLYNQVKEKNTTYKIFQNEANKEQMLF